MATKNKTLRSFFNKPKVVNEIFTKKSQTVPNEALTVREVITKFANGTLPPIGKESLMYSEDMEDTRFMDISERMEIINAAKDAQKNGKQQIQDLKDQDKAEKQKARELEISQKAVKDYIKQQGETS